MLLQEILLILKFKVGYMNSIGVVLNNHIETTLEENILITDTAVFYNEDTF